MSDGANEHVQALDRHDAPHVHDQGLVLADIQLSPQGGTVAVGRTFVSRQVEAQRDDAKALRGRDPNPDQVPHGRFADSHQRVAEAPEGALEPPVRAALQGSEVALEHVAVVGVDDHRPGSHGERGCASDESRLRGVRVDDVRSKPARDPRELRERHRVSRRRHGLGE
jgi:hypothetical protein